MPAPSEEFLEACAEAQVPPADRTALWQLYLHGRSRASGKARIGELMADHGHWRLFVLGRDGDAEAARRFAAYWRAAARRFLGRGFTREQVEEFTALFFARVYEHAPGFRWATTFTAYLRTILLNIARDEIRRLRRSRARDVELDGDEGRVQPALRVRDPDAEQVLLEGERRRGLERALARLAEGDRKVLLACVVEGRPGEEVAAALGIRRDALYQRLKRARERLRALLAEELSDRGGPAV